MIWFVMNLKEYLRVLYANLFPRYLSCASMDFSLSFVHLGRR